MFNICEGVGGGYSLGYESRGNCSRSKPIIMSSSLNTTSHPINRSQSFAQQRSPAASGGINSSPSVITDYEEEDSMHEKYFSPHILSMHGKKSSETTPLVRTRLITFFPSSFNCFSIHEKRTCRLADVNIIQKLVHRL